MATTTEDRPGTVEERPAGAPPPLDAQRRRRFRFRDMYVERRDGPVTMAERRRRALPTSIGVPVLAAVVVGIQAIRGREVATEWLAGVGVVTVVLAALAFAFPRFSLGGHAHLRNIDWSRESTGSKVVAVVAVLLAAAVVVAGTIHRLDR